MAAEAKSLIDTTMCTIKQNKILISFKKFILCLNRVWIISHFYNSGIAYCGIVSDQCIFTYPWFDLKEINFPIPRVTSLNAEELKV